MKRNLIIIGIMLLFVMSSTSLSIGAEKQVMNSQKPVCDAQKTYVDDLDQNQSVFIDNISIPVGRFSIAGMNFTIQVAQSFIPSKEILTRVEVLIGKNSTATYPYVLGIRDNLTHENLVEVSIPPEEVPSASFSWVEFDVEDLWVTPGQTYYLVSYTTNATDNWYAWAANNHSDAYLYGCAWISLDNGSSWNQSELQSSHQTTEVYKKASQPLRDENETGDMCFRTYGVQATTLGITIGGTVFATSIVITNTGNATAWDVAWEVSISGGILHMLKVSINGTQASLEPGAEIPIRPGFFFGLGPLTVTARASAFNAHEVVESRDAFLIFIFVLWR